MSRGTVRRAVSADADRLACLGAKTFRETFAASNTEEDMANYLAESFGPAIQAAEIAERAGIALAIASGLHDAPIARATSEAIGTLFLPKRKDAGRKAWLGGRLRLKGALVIDAGAARALGKGSSLLAAGVVRVEGEFQRGDAVAIRGEGGETLDRKSVV